MTGVRDLVPGERFPDLSLPDSDSNVRQLTELAGRDPLLVHTYRGWFCPKERAYLRRLVDLQGDAEVAYTRFVSLSVESPAVNGAFRAGLDASSRPTLRRKRSVWCISISSCTTRRRSPTHISHDGSARPTPRS